MKGSAAGHAAQAAHGLIPQVSVPVTAAVAGVGIAFSLYCVLTSNRVFRHLRRFGISCLTAMILAAAGTSYINHIRHARIVASSAGPGSSVTGTLLSAWGFGSLILTIPVFLLATWFTRRRSARLGRGLQSRRAPARSQIPVLPMLPGADEGGWIE